MRLRSRSLRLALIALAMPLAGCASIVGTWQAERGDTPGRFKFGAVSFVGDGTYTGEMRYEDEVLTNSGGWKTSGDRLMLTNPQRTYRYELEDGRLIITDLDRNVSVALERLRP